MKKFIAFCIFMIGLVLCWPPGEQVKASVSDHVCFVADIGHAETVATIPNNIEYQSYEFVALKPPIVCVADGIIQKAPDFYKMYALNYRTCLNSQLTINYNKLQNKSCVNQSIIRIRDDTQV